MMSNGAVTWFARLRYVCVALMAVCVSFGVGCNLSDTGPSAHRPSDQFFAVLSLEHHAINLSMVAPYNTVTLHTIREMGDGSVVPGEVEYSVSDPSLSITNGVLKAESPTAGAVVRVKLTYGLITRTDSAIVSVIADAPNRLRAFGLRVPPGDSAKIALSQTDFKTIPILRESESGSDLSTLFFSVRSSDTTVALIKQSGSTVTITPKKSGRVMLYTSTYAFGTVWQNSLMFTVGWPLVMRMNIYERFPAGSLTKVLDFAYKSVTIGAGGCVQWITQSTELDADMQFQDPSHVDAPGFSTCGQFVLDNTAGGNIEPFRAITWDGDPNTFIIAFFSRYRARVFSAPGVFPYQSTIQGTGGVIRVCDEQNDTTCAPAGIGSWY